MLEQSIVGRTCRPPPFILDHPNLQVPCYLTTADVAEWGFGGFVQYSLGGRKCNVRDPTQLTRAPGHGEQDNYGRSQTDLVEGQVENNGGRQV